MSYLNFTCWNCSGIFGNYSYARKLLQNTDILALSEHWLYNDELDFLDSLDNKFSYYASSSSLNDELRRWKRGQGGVGLLWRKDLKVKKLTATDTMIAIKIKTGFLQWTMVCGVYLPSTNHTLTEFKEAISALEQLCLRERGDDNLIILGDFNGHISGARSFNKENTRGRLVREAFTKLGLTATNLMASCMGPRHTYESSTAYSTIDYIWVDNYLVEQLKRSEVMNMHSDNVTHHLPMEVTIMFPGESASFEVTEILTRPKVAWKKCSAEQFCSYQNSLDENLHSLSLDSEDNPESIEKYVRAILESVNIASTMLPHVKYKSYIKPYWNKKLTTLKKIVTAKHKLWVQNGQPRGRNHQTFEDYKEAKRLFRKEQRRCIQEYELKEYEGMVKAAEQNFLVSDQELVYEHKGGCVC